MEHIKKNTRSSLRKYSQLFLFSIVWLNFVIAGNNQPILLTRYSLEAYLPEIGDQGDVGSCVGWASTYYGLTIIKRIEHGQNYPAFSALSTYNRYCFFYDKNPCYGGSQIDGSLEVLKKFGSPFMKDYALQNCAYDPDKKIYKDRLYDYDRLQHMNYFQIKSAISNNRPVVIGMNVYAGGKGNSLNTKFLDSSGVIKIENFKSDFAVSGHAMCIIGYDDQVGGGAFKLVNSWGKEWGKSGFCWLRYKDLEILRAAYALIPNELVQGKVASNYRTRSIEFINSSVKNYYISYGFSNVEGIQVARGWYYIPSEQSRIMNIASRRENEVFFILMDDEGQVFESNINAVYFPIDRDKFFDSNQIKADNSFTDFAYFSVIPKNKRKTQQLFISGNAVPKLSD